MKILLIALAAVGIATGYGEPTREQQIGGRGNPAAQVPQNLSPENLAQPSSATPRASFQVKRQEFRRYGIDAFPTNSQSDTTSYNSRYEIFDEENKNSQNAESQSTLHSKKQRYVFPPVDPNRNVGLPRPNSFQQDLLKSDSPFNYQSPIKTSLDQEIHNSGVQSGEERTSFSEFHNQEIAQREEPFHSSQIQGGLRGNQNEFSARFPTGQNQLYQPQQAELLNQDLFNPASAENQQPQFQRQSFYQRDSREDSGINQDMQSLNRNSPFSQQDQLKASRAPQAQIQHNEQSTISANSARDTSFNQQKNSFESRRISPSEASRQPFQNAISGQEKYIPTSTQFQSNQSPKDQQSRLAGNIPDSRFTTDIHFTEDANKQNQFLSNKFDTGSRTQDISQGLLQNLGKEQPVSTLPQFRQTHSTSVLVSGGKGVAAPPPVMVYKSGSVASPHAVVIGKGSGVASIRQHLHTPFTQYTYSHPL